MFSIFSVHIYLCRVLKIFYLIERLKKNVKATNLFILALQRYTNLRPSKLPAILLLVRLFGTHTEPVTPYTISLFLFSRPFPPLSLGFSLLASSEWN